jgi:plastocyanin
MRLLATLAFALCIPAFAWSADLTVFVKTSAGKPVADAVVMARPDAGTPREPIRFSWPYSMAQKDMRFTPFVLIVPVGADVSFPNLDLVLHHVYSFSPAKSFELKLYGHDETRKVRFDKVGVVAIGCNIHDSMAGFVRVVDTPYAAKTDASGRATLRDLPAGGAQVTVWHPYLKAARNEATVRSAAGQTLTVTTALRAPPVRRSAY